MPEPHPKEFRDDVVRVARDRPGEKLAQFGISESCLTNWMRRQADVEDGNRPGVTRDDVASLREACTRICLLEQENEVLRRATVEYRVPRKLVTRPKSPTRLQRGSS